MFVLIVVMASLMITGVKNEIQNFNQTTPENVPFYAIIESDEGFYVGALISRKFFIALANPDERFVGKNVFLGFPQIATIPLNTHNIKRGSHITTAKQVIWHEDLGRTKGTNELIYNIALIELNIPAPVSKIVRPIKLPFREMFPLITNTQLNVTGLKFKSGLGTPQYATVQLRSQDKCKLFFGNGIEMVEEYCYRTKSSEGWKDPLTFYGPVTIEDELVGLTTAGVADKRCEVTSASCGSYQVFVGLRDSLDWIYENSDVIDKD